jgi:hypothetical protein
MRVIRVVLLLVAIALAGPGAAAALATGSVASRANLKPVGNAPIAFSVGQIEFALEKGDNAQPVNPNTRFAYGTRTVWAFWPWSDAKKGARVNYVLRFGGTDVAWGSIDTDNSSGRMEVGLERLDGLPLDLGLYRLYLDAAGTESGNVRQAEFVIYDPHAGDDGNGNSNNNGNNNNNNNNNNNSNENNNNNNNNSDDGNNNNNNTNDNFGTNNNNNNNNNNNSDGNDNG